MRARSGFSKAPMTEADPGVTVLHRDAHLLVLHKPAWLPTTAPDDGPCLVTEARGLDPDAPRVHPTSRLDSETTGVVIFARTRRATRALLAARKQGQYRRVYVALAAGNPPDAAGTWTWGIARDRRDPRRRVAVDEGHRRDDVQHASSEYRVAGRLPSACVLHVWPGTGRTHQIRVHAARAGVPLLGDVYYRGPRRRVLDDGTVVTARRVMLHCAAVGVPHPVDGRSMRFHAAVPADLRNLWHGLGGGDGPLEPRLEEA